MIRSQGLVQGLGFRFCLRFLVLRQLESGGRMHPSEGFRV